MPGEPPRARRRSRWATRRGRRQPGRGGRHVPRKRGSREGSGDGTDPTECVCVWVGTERDTEGIAVAGWEKGGKRRRERGPLSDG